MIAREEREYALADRIVVLSSFARNSFFARGRGRGSTSNAPFRSRDSAVSCLARSNHRQVYERIESGRPLEVLTVGSFTARKGCLDLGSIAAALGTACRFQFVGDLPSELKPYGNLRAGA